MNLFRFQEDKSAQLTKAKLKNNTYYVSDIEAYKVDPTSVGFIWRSRLFGFGKPKRTPVVSVRVNDGSTLHPLNPKRINSKPMSYIELNSLENASFLQSQLEMEKKGSGMFTGQLKYLFVSIFAMVICFIFIALPSAIPFVLEQYSNILNEEESEIINVDSPTEQTSN